MFHREAYENSIGDGLSVLEVTGGAPEGEEQPRLFVPLKRTELTGEIAGPLASLRLVQTYGYAKEQYDRTLEAVYRFPLPGDAAVTGVQVRFGEVAIRAELKERAQAEAEYKAAKSAGRQAALTTRESPDVFTLQVAGLQPGHDVTVESEYVQLARVEGLSWSLRIPLTTAPRYVREDEAGSRHAAGQPLAVLRDPGHRFRLDLTLRGAISVGSATHRLNVTPEEPGLRVQLAEGEVLPDRDCVLTWQPPQEEGRPTLRVMLHEDQAAGQVYFLALVTPPSPVRNAECGMRNDDGPDAVGTPHSAFRIPHSATGVPREVVLLVDHSGSMEGAKWEAADWAVKRFLAGLGDEDAFALGLFHSTTQWFGTGLRDATPRAVAEAISFLEKNRDTGGTNLGVALEQALSLPRTEGERARHVLVVTDAEVTDAARILRLADEEAKQSRRRRINVLCIDAAPNAFLATELAERGGGVARFLTSAPEEEDISTALDTVLEEWAPPVLTDLCLEVSRAQVEAVGREVRAGREAGRSTIDLGDLPAGRSVWVAGRAPRVESAELVFRLGTQEGGELASRRLQVAGRDARRPALKALFGARRVLGLEFLMGSGADLEEGLARMGYDPAEVLGGRDGASGKVYAENVRAGVEKRLRGLLVREALDYGLASAETAFVAQREEAGKRVEESVTVANALPSGWSERFVHSPARIAMAMAQPTMLRAMAVPMPAPSHGNVTRVAARFARMSAPAANVASQPPRADASAVLFDGIPTFTDGTAVLFDSATGGEGAGLPEEATFLRLEVWFPEGAPEASRLDPGLMLMLYVGDPATPRARVRLADLLRQGGARPLNVLRRSGDTVRLVMEDPRGIWARNAPRLEAILHW